MSSQIKEQSIKLLDSENILDFSQADGKYGPGRVTLAEFQATFCHGLATSGEADYLQVALSMTLADQPAAGGG